MKYGVKARAQQLAETDATLSRWMRAGFPFSRAPGMGYEYSNTGFAILGLVLAATLMHAKMPAMYEHAAARPDAIGEPG